MSDFSTESQHTSDLWFSCLASHLGHRVRMTTQTMYLRFRPHVPHLIVHATNPCRVVDHWHWIW